MLKQLSAGQLHQKISVERSVETRNEDGQVVRTWSELICDRTASVMPVGGTERFWSGLQVQAESRFLVRLWFDSISEQITETMRIVWNGRRYGITRVYDPDNRRREIAIECKDQS
jgi:SPP1 family predicted phage head-tail adaptor